MVGRTHSLRQITPTTTPPTRLTLLSPRWDRPSGGNVDYMFDFDFFRVQAEEGQTYRMAVNHRTLRPNSLTLFAADGLSVESWISRVRVSSGEEILWLASSFGEHHFAVQNFGGKKGQYTLRIAPVRPT